MAFIPPPHPNTRPRVDGRALDNAGDRAFVAEWLGHVAAGRVGGRSPCGPTAALLEAGGRPTAPLLEAEGLCGPAAALLEAEGRPTVSLHEAGRETSDPMRAVHEANAQLFREAARRGGR